MEEPDNTNDGIKKFIIIVIEEDEYIVFISSNIKLSITFFQQEHILIIYISTKLPICFSTNV